MNSNNRTINLSTTTDKNIVTVSNNNVKYYEKLAEKYSQMASKSVTAIASYANSAKEYYNSCKTIKETIDNETLELVNAHSEREDNPHKVTSEQVGTYSQSEIDSLLATKQNSDNYALKSDLEHKNPILKSGENISITDNDDGSQTISSLSTVQLDYLIAENKPSINSVTLSGDKTSNELGLASLSDIPQNLSELENDVGFFKELPDLSFKQDTLTSGDGIKIAENVISTTNRLDCDLSNITDVGIQRFDGSWNFISPVILSSAVASGNYDIYLGSDGLGVLPDDDYAYEVLIYLYATQTTSGSDVTISIGNGSDLAITPFAKVTKSSIIATNSIVYPLDKDKHFIISLGNKPSACKWYITAYRRLGKFI